MLKKTTAELVAQRPTPQQLADLPRFPIYVILDNVRSLENVGLIFRLCDALRVEKLYLTGITGYPPLPDDPRPSNIQTHAYNQIAKTGIKLVPYVPWEYKESITKLIADLKKRQVQIVSLEQTFESVSYLEPNYKFPLAIVLGHEREGVGDKVLAKSDLIIDIPMYGMGNSLNIATALAAVGYELVNKFSSK